MRPKIALLVEDEPALREALAWILKRAGWRVLRAGDIGRARRICRRATLPLDVIVSDIELPDGSGFDFGEEVAARRPEIPVLYISGGYGEHDPAVRRHLRPGRGFLEKPFTEAMLLSGIAGVRAGAFGMRALPGSAGRTVQQASA